MQNEQITNVVPVCVALLCLSTLVSGAIDPLVGDQYLFTVKSEGFFSGYYDISATCRKIGGDYRIFTEDILVNDISISPLNSDHILIATSSGVYVSLDAGANWQSVNGSGYDMLPSGQNSAHFSESELPSVHRASINRVLYLNEENWWCGYQGGAYHSIDNGVSWNEKTRGLASYLDEDIYETIYPAVYGMKMDSRIVDYAGNRDYFACTDAGLFYWAGVKFIDLSNGLARSANGWDHLSVYDFINIADTAYIASENGIFKGVFNLETEMVSWMPVGGMTITINNAVYDADNDRLKLFISGIEPAVYVNIYDTDKSLFWIDEVKTSGELLYVEISSENVYYHDVAVFDTSGMHYNDLTVSDISVNKPGIVKMKKIIEANGLIYCLSETALYKIDALDNFTQIYDFGMSVNDLTIFNNTLYIATENGLLSSDSGNLSTWANETPQILHYNGQSQSDYVVKSVRVNDSGDIFIGCHDGGLLKRGASSDVWVNLNSMIGHRDLNSAKIDYISKAFDSLSVHQTVKEYFGNLPDIDEDSKMNILVMDIQDYYYLSAGDGVSFIDGYYDPINQLHPSTEPKSNACDIFYLDSNPLDLLADEGFAAIAHYLAAMILLNQDFEEEAWVVKGLGEFAEFLCGLKDPMEIYNLDINNSLTFLGDFSPLFKDYQYCYLVFLYLYEHYFSSIPGDIYNRSMKAIVDCTQSGIDGINACLSNAGYSEDFEDVFSDIAISSILEEINNNSLFIEDYQWDNAIINCTMNYLNWGFTESSYPPYYRRNMGNWAFYIFRSEGMKYGYDMSPELGDTITFQGSSDQTFRVFNIFTLSGIYDENTLITEMNLDDKNWGSADITQFGDAGDPYQVLYTIVVLCTDSDDYGQSGDFIVSNNLDDYYANPWGYYQSSALSAGFQFFPIRVHLTWDDIFLGGDNVKTEETPNFSKMDAQTFKEYNYLKSSSPTGGVKISSLDGFEGFNVYKTDVLEYYNKQDLINDSDSTFHSFSGLPNSGIVYSGEIELWIKSYSPYHFAGASIYIDGYEISYVSLPYGCQEYHTIIMIPNDELMTALQDQDVEIKIKTSATSAGCDENYVNTCLRLYIDKQAISTLQSQTEFIDTDVSDNSSYGYLVNAQFNGIESEPTNLLFVSIPSADSISNLWTGVSNYGSIGDPNVPVGMASMEWPGGSNTHYLWEGRFWVGAIVDGEKRVSHADYGNYEWRPSEVIDGAGRPQQEIIQIGTGKLEYSAVYDDLETDFHDTEPLNLKVFEHTKLWPCNAPDSALANTMLIEQNVVNIGNEALNDILVSWVYDCDVGTGIDPISPNIDDLVNYEGWDGPDSDTDEEDLVENIDWNNNGVLDGYDENGIPYGWQFVGSPDIQNPNYDINKISPDGYPDEYQVVITESDTLLISRMMSYMYDGNDPESPDEDTGENGKVEGFIGVRLLYSPSGGIHSHQWWNWESDPGSDRDKYDFMNATHAACLGYKRLPNPFQVGAPVFDYRLMLTTGPFYNFQPNDTIHFQVGVILGKGIEGIRRNSDAMALQNNQLHTMVPIDREISFKPVKFSLKQNFPNPFNPVTSIAFEMPKATSVRLTVYNMLGQSVRTLVNDNRQAGRYTVLWDGRDDAGHMVGSGIYFYQIQAGSFTKTAKMVFLK